MDSPENYHVPWKLMVGRCSLLMFALKSFFVWHVSFRGCILFFFFLRVICEVLNHLRMVEAESTKMINMRQRKEENIANSSWLVGGFKCFLLLPLAREVIQFDEHIFQMGWNQPDEVFGCFSWTCDISLNNMCAYVTIFWCWYFWRL